MPPAFDNCDDIAGGALLITSCKTSVGCDQPGRPVCERGSEQDGKKDEGKKDLRASE